MIKNSRQFLFLAGAPKCGTTFLFNILKNHSELNPSFPKETYYFCDKEHTGINEKKNYHLNGGTDSFFDYFNLEGPKFYLEATTHLIYQQEMFDVIKSLGNVKMVFLTRNPIERITSTFNYTKYNLANIKSNKEYTLDNYVNHLLAKDTTELKKWLRDERGYYVFKRELEYCHYDKYIDKWRKHLGSENVKLIPLDELKKNQDAVVDSLIEWLGLAPLSLAEAKEEKKNSSYTVKSTKIHQKVIKLASLLPKSTIKEKIKSLYLGLQDKGKGDQLSDENFAKLQAHFNIN